MLDAVIVGAGAAGIAAARRLRALELSYLLLEAKAVAGGRALTDAQTLGVPVDLGCHWLHSPAHNPLKGFADALGVRYLPHDYVTRLVRGGHALAAAEAAACNAYVDACFERVARAGHAGRDCAAADAIDDASPWSAAFVAAFTAKQGVPPEAGSSVDYARYVWEGDDLPVCDGLGSLVRSLAAGTRLRCGQAVSRIDCTHADRIRVHTADASIEARAAILTVSTGVLAHGITFTPPLPEWKRAAIEQLPMASCNKIALAFAPGALGEERDILVLPLREGHEATEILLRPDARDLAVCLVSGARGRELAAAGAETMRAHALEHLREICGSAVARAAQPAHVFADWDGDPCVRGYVAAALPGYAEARAALARDVDHRLYFAGEATHAKFMGDVHGAWLSGLDAANALARTLGAPPTSAYV